jgi:hypothetical protein
MEGGMEWLMLQPEMGSRKKERSELQNKMYVYSANCDQFGTLTLEPSIIIAH